MVRKRPATITEYIEAAPSQAQAHLGQLYTLLQSVAPDAQEAIKWGVPFFVEPKFLFSFSAHKAHLNFAPSAVVLEVFRKQLAHHQTTKMFLQIPYGQAFPEQAVRQLAEYQKQRVSERDDDGFW